MNMRGDGKGDLLFKLKPDVLITDLQKVNPRLLLVLSHFVSFCYENNLPCLITSIMEDNPSIERVSSTHSSGRGFDASSRGWGPHEIRSCVDYMEREVLDLGAYSSSDGAQRVVIYHDSGHGAHFHFQVKRE